VSSRWRTTFAVLLLACDLPEIVTFGKQQATQNTKNSLYRLVGEALGEERPTKEILSSRWSKTFAGLVFACNLLEIVAFRKQQATQNTKNSLYRLMRKAAANTF
jgi:hypothetical protein